MYLYQLFIEKLKKMDLKFRQWILYELFAKGIEFI